MYFVDTHAHLKDTSFIKKAEEKGVEYIVNVSTDEESIKKVLCFSKKYKNVFATIGVHPKNVKERVDIKRLRDFKDEKTVAIGEVGLDIFGENIEMQKEVFIDFVHLANTLSLPLMIHCRGAEEEMVKLLKEHKVEKRGVWHSFFASPEIAEEVTKLGFFLSFSPGVLKKKNLSSILSSIALDRILIETDSPYIGKSPADVIKVAEKIAELSSLTLEDVARITSVNAYLLFGVGEEPKKGVLAYNIRESLYLNITNRCTNDCVFCVRKLTDFVKGHHLRIKEEPSATQLLDAVKKPGEYKEIVFCGYGEPTLRLDIVEQVGESLRRMGAKSLRLNTNGHTLLINGEDSLDKIAKLFDEVCVSVNVADEEDYYKICRPVFGKKTFSSVIHFIKRLKPLTKVTLTAVDYPGVKIDECRKLAESLSLPLRIRRYKEVG